MNDKNLNCMDCFYYEIKYGIGYYCNLDNKPLGELGCMNDICINFKLAVYTEIDVSGTGYDTEIRNVLTGEQYGVKGCVKLLNELYYKKEDLKELLVNSEPVLEQKELQKLIYKIVRDLIDNKLEESEEGFQQTYDSWYQGRIDALNELKKELDVV